ncbi:EF-Hand 1, calcium-binding site [Phytophthora cactorum]|nr:EF-Hand 1, calcium-binding site [Phytophthora cactorum]
MPLHMPYHSTMDKEVVKAAGILDSCFSSTVSADAAIPAEMIQNAAGLAFLTVVKAGLIWTGKMGTGVVVARLEDGSAVKTFKKGTQISVGAGLDLAVGPVGRTAGASVNAGGGGISGNYTYSHAKGAFAGVGLHGSTFMVRGEMNSQFYGRKVTPAEILSGQGLGVEPNPNSLDLAVLAVATATAVVTETPDAADHNAAARASFSSSNREQQSTHTHPTNPSLKYKSYPAPAPNGSYTSPPEAQAVYNSPTAACAPLPPSAKGAEMKQVYSEVMNLVQTKCPYANLQVFKDNCRLFGQDAMSLDAYFSYLLSICSHPLMKELVPQLVRLLPTQEKRERLWEEIDACRESFVHFDKDGSGTIDKYELSKVLEAMGQKPTDEELFQMIAEVDNDHSGEIEFAEFLQVIEAQKLRAAQFDDESDFIDAFVACGGNPDKTGHVERKMLVQLIKKDFGLPIDIDRMLDELDTDGSGEIEYDEFKALLS